MYLIYMEFLNKQDIIMGINLNKCRKFCNKIIVETGFKSKLDAYRYYEQFLSDGSFAIYPDGYTDSAEEEYEEIYFIGKTDKNGKIYSKWQIDETFIMEN